MKILIIKLGALGDVIRTIPVVRAIKNKYPDSEVHWVTKSSSKEILENLSFLHKIHLPTGQITDAFDILYNFDTDKEAIKLASKIPAQKKYGFYDKEGYVGAFNLPAEYYLNTLFDDELKKANKKTYQQMMFETAEFPYEKLPYSLVLTDAQKKYARDFVKKNNLNSQNLIGIHIGSSPRWPSKSWHESKIIEFIKKLKQNKYEPLIFSGPDDFEKLNHLEKELQNEKIQVIKQDPLCTISEFASLVDLCSAVVCSDSLALHISLAMKKPTIGLFFCTSPDEIESYGLLKKIVSPNLPEFFPEKMDEYNEDLVKSITSDEVITSLEEIFKSLSKAKFI